MYIRNWKFWIFSSWKRDSTRANGANIWGKNKVKDAIIIIIISQGGQCMLGAPLLKNSFVIVKLTTTYGVTCTCLHRRHIT